ncbi:hypothetical protein V5J36_001266 [Endozoicomonas sp. NE41]
MANMFMSIEGIDFPGATITVTGEKPGRGAAPSWCSIDSFYWESGPLGLHGYWKWYEPRLRHDVNE